MRLAIPTGPHVKNISNGQNHVVYLVTIVSPYLVPSTLNLYLNSIVSVVKSRAPPGNNFRIHVLLTASSLPRLVPPLAIYLPYARKQPNENDKKGGRYTTFYHESLTLKPNPQSRHHLYLTPNVYPMSLLVYQP